MRNNFKKIAAIVLALVMSVSALVPAFAANACDHAEYDVVSTTAATCGVSGVEKRTCKACDETFVVVLPALAHEYAESVIDATCTDAGTITNVCSICGDVKTETVEKLGHTWVYEWDEKSATKDTCVAGSKYTKRVCSVCAKEEAGDTIADGHEWELVTVTKAPTCKTTGLATYKCADCGKVLADQAVAKLTGHTATVIATIKAATCDANATVRYNCATCGTVEAEAEGTKGHGQNGWKTFTAETATALTCTTNEVLVTDKVCKDCNALCNASGAAYTADQLKAKAAKCTHFFVATGSDADGWFVRTAATCTAAGESYRTCLDCGKEETRTDKALDHAKGTYVDKKATCTEAGEAYFPCTRCDEKLEYTTTAALGHDMKTDKVWYNAGVAGDPDEDVVCGEQYQILNWCDRCSYSLNPKVEKFADHVYTEVKVAATCSTYAYSYKACVCGAVEVTDKTDADGKYDIGTAYAPESHVYTDKDGNYTDIVSAVGGQYANCTKNATYTVVCGLCGTGDQVVNVAAYGHKYDTLPEGFTPDKCVAGKVPGKAIELVAGTGNCLVASQYKYSCTVCGAAKSGTETAADGTGAGHVKDLKNGYIEATAPTCTVAGTTEGYNCANPWCGIVVVAAKVIAPHHAKDNLVKTEAVASTCTENGNIEYYTCKLGADCAAYNKDTGLAYTTNKAGAVITDPKALVDEKDGHSVAFGTTKGATCTTVQYQTGVCTACDAYIEVADYAASTGHTPDPTKTVTEYICEVGVFTTNVCTVCELVVTTQNVDAEGKAIAAPHYNAEGNALTTSCANDVDGGRKCVECGLIVKKADHEFGAWVVDGVKAVRTCVVCGTDDDAVTHVTHAWDDGVKADDAVVYTCFCGATKTEAVENDAPVDQAPVDTDKPADETPAKKGCGSSIAAVAVALVATLGTCVVFAGKKRD